MLILKLADRVHNMRSIDGIRERKRRRRIAQETADVYAPLAHRMGIGFLNRIDGWQRVSAWASAF